MAAGSMHKTVQRDDEQEFLITGSMPDAAVVSTARTCASKVCPKRVHVLVYFFINIQEISYSKNYHIL